MNYGDDKDDDNAADGDAVYIYSSTIMSIRCRQSSAMVGTNLHFHAEAPPAAAPI
jgi:hypothetical protein